MEFLYSDDQIVAVNKPAGLLSIPDGYDKTLPNLKQQLESQFTKIWTIHRLDKETSGVIIFALTADAHRNLSIQFETRKIEKTYLSLVHGALADESVSIDVPLRVNGDRKHRTVPDLQHGKLAHTRIFVVEKFEFFTLVRAHPLTGYLHQIRAHLLYIGHPVVNDRLYCSTSLSRPIKLERLMLHALNIAFNHPVTGLPLMITAPQPEDFSQI